MILSDEDERLKELETWFINRGYNSGKVRPDIDRVKTINRNDLLTKREKEIILLQEDLIQGNWYYGNYYYDSDYFLMIYVLC